jgi:hypothetical protein
VPKPLIGAPAHHTPAGSLTFLNVRAAPRGEDVSADSTTMTTREIGRSKFAILDENRRLDEQVYPALFQVEFVH